MNNKVFVVNENIAYDYGGDLIGVFNTFINARKAIIKRKLILRKEYSNLFNDVNDEHFSNYIKQYWCIYETEIDKIVDTEIEPKIIKY